MSKVVLKKGREESLLRRHPWVFSGAIAGIEDEPVRGATVEIRALDGRILGRAAWSPHSQISARVWSFDPGEQIDAEFFRRRLVRAFSARRPAQDAWGNGCGRLVYAEADGLPGIVVDRYAGFVVCQFLSAGAEFWRETICGLIAELAPGVSIYERSDADSREKEGLEPRSGLIMGDEPPELVEVDDGRFRFLVDIAHGHKTGFYLDQRENRMAAAGLIESLRGPCDVLDCFSYTGSFTVAALAGGASWVTAVESSPHAIATARRNTALNGLDLSRVQFEEENVFVYLRRCRDEGRTFGAVILDPPKFAGSRGMVEAASRGYKDINLLAMKLLAPGGLLVTFSCSQHIGADMFERILAFAAMDAGRDVQIVRHLRQAGDHPVALNFPESAYLKGAACRVW